MLPIEPVTGKPQKHHSSHTSMYASYAYLPLQAETTNGYVFPPGTVSEISAQQQSLLQYSMEDSLVPRPANENLKRLEAMASVAMLNGYTFENIVIFIDFPKQC